MASELGVQTIQHTNGTDAMTIDSSGRLTQGSPVGFSARVVSDVSASAAGTRFTNWGITTSQLYGGFNTNGAGGGMLDLTTGIVTIPVTGYYSINLNARIDSFAGAYHFIDIIKTDSSGTYDSGVTTLLIRVLESATAPDYTAIHAHTFAYLSSGELIAAFWNNSGDNNVTLHSSTYFSMFKVG